MGAYADLKASRPVRFFLAFWTYRLLWWPVVGLLLPFFMIGSLVDWLSWTAFPAIAKTFRPVGSGLHEAALSVGNAVLGYTPEKPQ